MDDTHAFDPSFMDPADLRPLWTRVNAVNMFALASTERAMADSPAIVLVHGSGLSHRYMIPTARELTPHFRVYVPDLPGFGESGDPPHVLDVAELGDWLVAWMRSLGLARASLLGNSFGCQVIAELARRHADVVQAAILQGPTTPPSERSWFWQFVRWRQNQRFNPKLLDDVTAGDYRHAGLRRMYRSFRFQLEHRIEDAAPFIPRPVLVVRGEHDPIASQSWCEEIAHLCPQGHLAIIPNVAHTLCFTAPTALAEVTRSFIEEHAHDAPEL